MPTAHTITLNSAGPDPNPVSVTHGDTVTFTNNTGDVTVLTLPTPPAFVPAPESSVTIANEQSAGPYTANATGGSYSYTVGRTKDPRGGTIDAN